MANVKNVNGFEPYQFFGHTAFPMWHGKMKSNVACAIGDALSCAGGYLYKGAGTGAAVGVATTAITSNTTPQDVFFVPALADIVFSGSYGSGTGMILSNSRMWSNARYLGNSGKMYLTNSGNSICRIIGIHGNYSLGYYAKALFIFRQSAFTGQA